jgi:hypothetical protein
MTSRSPDLLRHFGLDAHARFWSDRHEEQAARIRRAVEGRRLLAVIGRFGSGKSVLVKETLDEGSARPVYVNNPDKRRLRISHVVTALVSKLSTESPRQDMIARTSQLARVLGERAVLRGQEIVVVIENAHRMHANTLLALKDLRESALFQGVAPLFTALLVGQEPLLGKVQKFGEVRYRTKSIQLTPEDGWMDYPERFDYLTEMYGEVIAPPTRERIAGMYETPLEMDYFIEGKLELMRDAGIDVMTAEEVPISLRERRKAAGISQAQLERHTRQSDAGRVPKSTISEIERDVRDAPETEQRLSDAVDALISERHEGARPKDAAADPPPMRKVS